MIRNISFTINEARTKLTRLGMGLFYVYILLALIGGGGCIFGILSMVLKFIHLGSATGTPWLEVIILTLISGYMVKFFLRESVCLIRADEIQELPNDNEIEPAPQLSNSSVIPFKRKSTGCT